MYTSIISYYLNPSNDTKRSFVFKSFLSVDVKALMLVACKKINTTKKVVTILYIFLETKADLETV